MASTFGYTLYVNSTGNVTNENVTGNPKHYHRNNDIKMNLITDKFKDGIVTFGAINATFAIAVNLLLLVTILTTRTMRRSLFYWNVINLCAAGLLSGLVIIPFFTNKFHHEKWFHGAEFCEVFTILEYTHLAFPGMVFICLQIDRFVKIRMSRNPTMHLGHKVLQIILLVFPWLFVLVICMPLVVIGQDDSMTYSQSLKEDYCVHILKEEYSTVLLYLMFISPVVVLIVFNVISLINFKLSESLWKRMSEHENDIGDPDSTRSTTKVMIIATTVFVLCWFPFLCAWLRFYMCFMVKNYTCLPSELEMFATYSCGMTSSYMRQLPWFLLPEMRKSVMELAQCTSSAFLIRMNDVRKHLSKGQLKSEWSTNQTELAEEKKNVP